MVSKGALDNMAPPDSKPPVVLSEGAGIALSSVFSRLVKPKAGEQASQTTGKRPRSERASVILAESEEVREKLIQEKEEARKDKEAKRAKNKFESNARVIPDAATGAALEKELLATATKGAVALFNAVSKAQKSAVEKKTSGKSKKSGPPLSREGFMDMIRAGVDKEGDNIGELRPESDSEDDGKKKMAKSSQAKWLKDDFLSAGSRKLKDWNKEDNNPGALGSSDEGSDGDADADSSDESGDESSEDSASGSDM